MTHRCRYARISHCREILGAQNVTETATEGEGVDAKVSTYYYALARLTGSNLIVIALFTVDRCPYHLQLGGKQHSLGFLPCYAR